MKIVTSEQMRRIDCFAIDKSGIPGQELMENAGRGIAEAILAKLHKTSYDKHVVIFCGKGNNGGDGFVIARYLHQAHIKVRAYHIGPPEVFSPDCRVNYDRTLSGGIELTEVTSPIDQVEIPDGSIIVDAIFGTGFSGTPRGLAAELIEHINLKSAIVVSVDMPSGLNADDGQFAGPAVDADYTFALGLPKFGLYLSPGRELSGVVEVIPIGIPDDAVNQVDSQIRLITPELVASLLPKRNPTAHKGDCGRLYLLAGSTGLSGAAVLCARAAIRAGAGLVKVGCPSSVQPTIANNVIEATSHPLPDVSKKGVLALRSLGEVRKEIARHDATVIGPGLGQHHETFELVRRLMTSLDRPAIIDADGLNALADHTDLLKSIKVPMALPKVLTPHPGEFKRLTGSNQLPENIENKRDEVTSFAKQHGVTLVLKGSPTLVADSNGNCYLNPTGNDGMATGGSGDVLSGIIGTFLAQGLSAIDASIAGVFIHGMAGDFAADEHTRRGMIAGDMIDYLSDVFMTLEG